MRIRYYDIAQWGGGAGKRSAERGEVEFFASDRIGRPAISGIIHATMPDDGVAPALTVSFAGTETGPGECGYTADTTEAQELLEDATVTSVTYYDSYGCRTFAGFADISSGFTGDATLAKGLPTATRTAVYGYDADNDYKITRYIYTLSGYDAEGRVTQQVETTILSGSVLTTSTSYTLQGYPNFSDITLQTTDSIYNVQLLPQYDAAGNLLTEASLVNSGYSPTKVMPASVMGNQAVVTYSYDELGRLSQKRLNSGNSIDYSYNLRGQLKGMSHPAFSQTLSYEDGATPCYNGNISAIKLNYGTAPTVTRSYSYDALNRLTACTSSDGYNTAYTYNLNSSPLTVQRYGLMSDMSIGLVDDLSMTYDGNRVMSVSDYAAKVILSTSLDYNGSDDDGLYGYDADGRLCSDSSRGITDIRYAPNSMPVLTKAKDGTFENYYTADGRKVGTVADITETLSLPGEFIPIDPGSDYGDELNERIDPGDITLPGTPIKWSNKIRETRYYIGPFELAISSNKGMLARGSIGLSRVNMSWGYVDSKGKNMEYVADYQGNIRAVTDGATVVQTTDYYPYGLPMANATGADRNRYKYSGKEFETRGGLNSYDFHARQYAPALPFFSSPDPKAGDYAHLNPYLYCAGNPIIFTDPTGERPIYSIDGTFLGTDEGGLQGDPIIMNESDFKPNMSQQAADDAAVSSDKIGEDAKAMIATHYAGLPNRPDYDGYLTFQEAWLWHKFGNGEPLYVDINKLALDFVSLEGLKVGEEFLINFQKKKYVSDEGLIFGQVTFVAEANNMFKCSGPDKYDFDMHPWTWKNLIRNIGTICGAIVNGRGNSFEIYIYGHRKAKK